MIVQASALVRRPAGRGGRRAGHAGGGGSGGPTAAQIDRMIQVNGPAIGFWLVLVALLAAIALERDGVAQAERRGVATRGVTRGLRGPGLLCIIYLIHRRPIC